MERFDCTVERGHMPTGGEGQSSQKAGERINNRG
jgi:hypothetical protein